jgi:hypothetical protein
MPVKPKNIILIVADSLRFDAVYRGSGPGVPYMEQHAVQFANARSAACWTLPGTASLFSGLMPHEHGACTQSRWFQDHIPSLASKLKTKGYKPIMVTANSVTTEVFNLSKDFDEIHKIWLYVQSRHPMLLRVVLSLNRPRVRKMIMKPDDEIFNKLSEDLSQGLVYAQKTCTDLFDKTRELMKANNEKGQGGFYFLNMMETHYPYHVSDTFELLSTSVINKMREWKTLYHMLSQSFLKTEKEVIKKDMLDLFRERQYRAWLLVRDNLNAYIEELHKDENNLVVFCSDHGDNFGDQGWQYHFSNVTDAGNKVPLFWFGHDHPGPETLSHHVSSRLIHQSILEAAGYEKQNANLFEESAYSLPLLQSYWYNNEGKTLEKYKYNQFCFINGNDRYVMRNGQWMHAPIAEGGIEPSFQYLGNGINPIEELNLDPEKRGYISETLGHFSKFSDEIMKKSMK